MILTKNHYRTLSLAAHQERTSSGAALLRGQGLFACYMDINLQPVIVLGQGRQKTPEAVEWGRPPAVLGPEDRRQVLPVLVSCQKEPGPPIPGFIEETASGEELPGKKQN